MCTLTRQCFNHQSSCCEDEVHFISSSGLEGHRARSEPSLGKLWRSSGASSAHSMPLPATAFQASRLYHFCWLSDDSVLTAANKEGEENTERRAKGSLSELHPPPPLFRHNRGGCRGRRLLKARGTRTEASRLQPYISKPL